MSIVLGILGVILSAALALGSFLNHAKSGGKPPFIYVIFLVVMLGNSFLNIIGS